MPILNEQDFVNAKRDIKDIGESVNLEKVIKPRWGASFKSLPLVSKGWENTLVQFNDAIRIAAEAGAGANGWTDLLIVKEDGKTQRDFDKGLIRKIVDSKLLNQLCAKMAAGEAIRIACYGDSTTDGDATSNFTPNPTDASGNAIGEINHNLTAPNAWANVLQAYLREMFNNQDIGVFNAGYSGKRIDNGWALANYDKAVTNNPFYGKPDICIIGFGLNDIAYSGFLDKHITQTKLLLDKLVLQGVLPILVSCNAVARSQDNVRAGAKASRQIDEAKATIAKQYGIPFFDVGIAQKQWLEKNLDGVRWSEIQSDSLHFNDVGHRFQAGFIAKELFRDLYNFKDGEKSLCMPTHDSRSNCKGTYSDYYKGANTRFLSNARFNTSDFAVGEPVVTAWVWNESPNAELIYRGIANEGSSISETTSVPKIKITKKVTLTEKILTPANVGFSQNWLNSEKPYRVSRLNYGLNKVEYLIGRSSAQAFMGYFEIMETERGSETYSNCLKNTGEIIYPIEPNKAKSLILPEFSDGSNIFGCSDDEYVEFYIDVSLAPYSGIIIGASSAYSSTGNVWGDKSYTYLYRGNESVNKTYMGRQGFYIESQKNASYFVWGDVNLSLSQPNTKLVVRYSKTNLTTVRIEMWSDWNKTQGYVFFDVDHLSMPMCPMTGSAGGLFYESNARTGVSVLHKMIKKVGKI